MTTVLYDGSFEGMLSAIFDVYFHKIKGAQIYVKDFFKGDMFNYIHETETRAEKYERVEKKLKEKLSPQGWKNFYYSFLSEINGTENHLFLFAQYVLSTPHDIERNYSNPSVLYVAQTGRKVWREKHRMEAFVRFQKTQKGLFYAVIQPDHNVLPLITKHFKARYADQEWLIYDCRRRYGVYYDKLICSEVTIDFKPNCEQGNNVSNYYSEDEELYQQLWKTYFDYVNIPERKNTKLHIQHLPRRYWKHLTEKQQ